MNSGVPFVGMMRGTIFRFGKTEAYGESREKQSEQLEAGLRGTATKTKGQPRNEPRPWV